MTLLGAVKDGSTIYLAADSFVWHSDGASDASVVGSTDRKFVSFPGISRIMVGYHGAETSGEPLLDSLVDRKYLGWGDLVSFVAGTARAYNCLIWQYSPKHVSLLLAGYFGDHAGIYKIQKWGQYEEVSECGFIGNGHSAAAVAYAVGQEILRGEHKVRTFVMAMEAAVKEFGELGTPAYYWRIGPSGDPEPVKVTDLLASDD